MPFRAFLSKLLSSQPQPSSEELLARLKNVEATQLQILNLLADLKRDDIPRNSNHLYKIGPARTALFLNDLLPEIYLTLVSVIQGIILAVLIDEFRLDYLMSNPAIYGYLISSFLIAAAFWYTYLTGVFTGRWPHHIIDTLLFFTAAIAEALAFRNVGTPSVWCAGIAVMTATVAVIYFRQAVILRRLVKADLYEDPTEVKIKNVIVTAVGFLLFAAIAIFFVPITSFEPQNLVAPVVAVLIPVIYIFYIARVSSWLSAL
jgi:hypothetical protein